MSSVTSGNKKADSGADSLARKVTVGLTIRQILAIEFALKADLQYLKKHGLNPQFLADAQGALDAIMKVEP